MRKQRLLAGVHLSHNAGYRGVGTVSFSATLAPGKTKDVIPAIEAQVDQIIHTFVQKGPTSEEVARAQMDLISSLIYDSDDQMELAQTYGWALTLGLTIEEVEQMPLVIQSVTLEEVQKAAQKIFAGHAITGILSPKTVA